MDTTNNALGSFLSRCKLGAFLFIFIWLSTGAALAQSTAGNGSIYGRIFDADTGRFMQNAEITIEGRTETTVSEQGGFYVLNSVPAGEITMVVSYAGYVTQKRAVTVTASGRIAVDFEMRLMPSSLGAPSDVSADAKKSDVIVLDKITVTTERAGNARAFMDQKNAMTLSTVVAADSFGTVQNGNIAEFLKNLPGISALEDDVTGEASEISIGGMDPQYTGVYMDGARMASGAKGAFDESSRTFQFDQVSINGVESIEIRRTVSADMDGDAPAGGISMRSKSAFDRKNAVLLYDIYLTGNSFALDASRTAGVDDGKSLKIQPGFILSYSTPLRENTMGLLVQLNGQTDYRENNRATNSFGSSYVNKVTYRNSQTQSERYNASIRFDWKISPFAKMSAQLAYNKRNTTSFNRNVSFNAGTKGNDSNTSNYLFWMSQEDQAATNVGVNQSASYSDSQTYQPTLTFNWKRYRFTFDAIATFSYSEGAKNPSNNKWFPQITLRSKNSNGSGNILWGQRDDLRSMEWFFYRGDRFTKAVNPTYMEQLGQNTFYGQDGTRSIVDPLATSNKQTIPTLKMDLRWDAPTRMPLWFKTGFNGRQSKFDAWQPTNSSGGALANHYQYVGSNIVKNVGQGGGFTNSGYDALSGNDKDPDVPSLSSDYYRSAYHFDPHFGGNVTDLNIPLINQTLLYSAFKNPSTNYWFYQDPADAANGRIAGYTGKRDLSETMAAGYLMGEIRPLPRLIFQAGYRYEYTNQESLTLIPLTKGQTHNILGTGGNSIYETTDLFIDTMYKRGERTKITKTYSFWLPSAAMKYNFTPNLTAHLGYSEGFGRLDVEKIAGNWKVNDSSLRADAPNPNLTPDRFKTYATSVEYYFEPAGSFTFTYTIRKWDGVSYAAMPIDSSNIDNPSPELAQLIAMYGRDTIETFVNNNYEIRMYLPESSDNRMMQTLEFGYRQRIPAIPGLQVDASFTRNVPNWRKTGASSAPKIASGGVSYSNRNFFVRVSGNWRDRYWTNWNESLQTGAGQSARFTLNLEMNYRLKKWLTIYFRGDNILNEPTDAWTMYSDLLREETFTGAALRLGIKGEF